jgi:hypothetical protein
MLLDSACRGVLRCVFDSFLGGARLTWTGVAAVPANVTHEVKHLPAYSLNIV